MKNFKHYFLLSLLAIFASCDKSEVDSQEPDAGNPDLQSIAIPGDFNFETERNVTMTISDETPYVMYEVFGYSSRFGNEAENIAEAFNNSLFVGRPTSEGIISYEMSLSAMYDKVYISRKDGIEYTYEIKDITNNTVNFTSPYENRSANRPTVPAGRGADACPVCVDDAAFQNGSFEDGPVLPTFPTGYVQTDESNVDGWDTDSSDDLIELWNSGFLGVASQHGDYHAEINATENAALSQRICTSPGATLSWSVWHRGREGVDVATVKIGPDLSAPVVVTMTDDETEWVNYSGFYVVPADQLDTYFIFEAVSVTGPDNSYGNFIDNIEIIETIPGNCDPNTNTLHYPAEDLDATIGFEDLWGEEGLGDYDFNDLSIGYNITVECDVDFNVTFITYTYHVDQTIASFKNGYGIQLPGVPSSAIASVTGQEDGHSGSASGPGDDAVIMFFDNADDWCGDVKTITITMGPGFNIDDLTTPPPFNPFLVANTVAFGRTQEVHLVGDPRTALGTVLVAADGNDDDGDYKADEFAVLTGRRNGFPSLNVENMPWALNIAGDWTVMQEGVDIFQGYPLFFDWAESGGAVNPLWFLVGNAPVLEMTPCATLP